MRALFVLIFQFLLLYAYAQPGLLDQSFNPTDPGNGMGTGPNYEVGAIARQADGKIVVGGSMTFFNSRPCSRLLRLTDAGMPDPTFVTGSGPNGKVEAIVIQPDNKLIVGGSFTAFNGSPAGMLVRLNPDGSIDNSFNIGAGYTGAGYQSIHALLPQPDGKILVGSDVMQLNGVTIRTLVRFNSDGSLDGSFTAPAIFNSVTYGLALQSDGKIIVGGWNSSGAIARLLPNGSIDNTFVTGAGFNSSVKCLVLQPDGKVLAGGAFATYRGVQAPRGIIRLNTDGSPDGGFQVAAGTGADSSVEAMALQPDGRILLGGYFFRFNGQASVRMVRLLPGGGIDGTFVPGNTFRNRNVTGLLLRPDQSIIYSATSGFVYTSGFLGAVDQQGAPVLAFNPPTGLDRYGYSITALSNGKLIVAGAHTAFNGRSTNGILRLQADLTRDTAFYPAFADRDFIEDVSEQADGKLLVTGSRIFYGNKYYEVVRLHPDGRWDSSFTAGRLTWSLNPGKVFRTIPLQGGKILVAGNFYEYNGVSVNNVVRLNPDGSIDPGFQVGTGPQHTVFDVKELPGGKLLISGLFSNYDGVDRQGIARLNSDGSLDLSFSAAIAINPSGVYRFQVQPDNKIVIAGNFFVPALATSSVLARLLPDGALDPSFIAAGMPGGITATSTYNFARVSLLPNGKILFAGRLTTPSGSVAQFLTGLNANGTVDAGFQSGSGPDSLVFAMQPLGDKVLITGAFTGYNGAGRNQLALINGTGNTTALSGARFSNELQIYPNPATDALYIYNPGASPVSVRIMDMNGRVLRQHQIAGGRTEVDVQTLPAGSYLIQAFYKSGKAAYSGLIVRR